MDSIIAEVCAEHQFGYTPGPVKGVSGRITSNGKNIYFHNCCFDVNSYGSSLICRNKGLTRINWTTKEIGFLNGMYYSKDMKEYAHLSNEEFAVAIARDIESKCKYPLMVKGADLHRGSCVFKAFEKSELIDFVKMALEMTHEIVVEEFFEATTYRVLVYKNEIVACYGKEPFHIVGDGVRKISELIDKKLADVNSKSIGTDLDLLKEDITIILNRKQLSLESILASGEKLILTDTASISKGGIAKDYTSLITEDMKSICVGIAESLNTVLCGIDIISKDISFAPEASYVLEVNSSPCLETYAKFGLFQYMNIYKLIESIIIDSLKRHE